MFSKNDRLTWVAVCLLAACGGVLLLSAMLQAQPVYRTASLAATNPTSGDKAFRQILNPDGTLNLERIGRASFQLNGWLMDVLPDGTPRFLPPHAAPLARPQAAAIGADSNWSQQFDLWGVQGGNGIVYTVLISDSAHIFVGGDFTQAGTKTAYYIAEWNSNTGEWTTLGQGVDGVVRDLALGLDPTTTGGATSTEVEGIYLAGLFTNGINGDGTPVTLNHVGFWNFASQTWVALADGTYTGVTGSTALPGDAYCVAVLELPGSVFPALYYPTVLVGGNFAHPDLYAAVFQNDSGSTMWRTLQASGETATGVNDVVNTCVSDTTQNQFFMGGRFTSAGDTGTNRARAVGWDVTHWTWIPLTGTLNNEVHALAFVDLDSNPGAGRMLYAGGAFTSPGNYLAWFDLDGSNPSWQPVGYSPNGPVYALEAFPSMLQAGGDFTAVISGTQTVTATRFVEYNAYAGQSPQLSSTVSPISADSRIWTIASYSTLYSVVGGAFNVVTDTAAAPPRPTTFSPNHVVRLDRSVPSARLKTLGQGIQSTGKVYAILVDGSNIYVGGQFQQVGGTTANSIARWNATDQAWDVLGQGIGGFGTVYALTRHNGKIYVGGDFLSVVQTDGTSVTANRIAVWDPATNSWSAVTDGSGNNGVSGGVVYALASDGTGVYLGGDFTHVGTTITATHIARWLPASSSWDSDPVLRAGVDGPIYSMVYDGSSNLYVGGSFSAAGPGSTMAAYNAAKWNGSAWSALTDGNGGIPGVNNTVYAMALDPTGNRLYVGGVFTATGNYSARHLAYWQGGVWYPLNGSNVAGTNNTVRALRMSGGGNALHVGGLFSQVTADNGLNWSNVGGVAVWNTSTNSWDTYGSGGFTGNGVYAIGFGTSYIGGDFTTVGASTKAMNFARFDKIGPTSVTLTRFEGFARNDGALLGLILLVMAGLASVIMRRRVHLH